MAGRKYLRKSRVLHGVKKTSQKKENKNCAFQSGKPPGFMDDGRPVSSDFDDEEHATSAAAIVADQQNNMEEKDKADASAGGESFRLYVSITEMKNVV